MICVGCGRRGLVVTIVTSGARLCRRCWTNSTGPVLNKQGKAIVQFPPTPAIDRWLAERSAP